MNSLETLEEITYLLDKKWRGYSGGSRGDSGELACYLISYKMK